MTFLLQPCWECHCPLSPFSWLVCSQKSSKWECDLCGSSEGQQCSWELGRRYFIESLMQPQRQAAVILPVKQYYKYRFLKVWAEKDRLLRAAKDLALWRAAYRYHGHVTLWPRNAKRVSDAANPCVFRYVLALLCCALPSPVCLCAPFAQVEIKLTGESASQGEEGWSKRDGGT